MVDRRHPWFDEEDYEEDDMSVVSGNQVDGFKEKMTNKTGFSAKGLDDNAELVLSKVMGDALHYIYFRVESLETVEVYSGQFGAETNFTKFVSLVDMDEYLTYLLFQDNYMVTGGKWRETALASLNVEEI